MAKQTLATKVKKYLTLPKVKKALMEGFILRRIRRTTWALICKLFFRAEENVDIAIGNLVRNIVLKRVPVIENRIVFWSFQSDYTDNPKYIAEELISRRTNCELIWIGRQRAVKNKKQFPKEVKKVYEWWTKDAFYALASAKILVVNSVELFKRPYPKKKGQIIIQTWHGSLGIKRFDKAVNSGKAWVKAAERNGKDCDYLVSNSSFETQIYRDTFWQKQEVWEVGHPRNDVLVNCTMEAKTLARKKLFKFAKRKDKGEYLFLYAPTFRDSKEFKCYDLKPDAVAAALKERFGGEWIGLYRYHPTVRDMAKSHKIKSDRMIDLTMYPDMQDLLQVANIGITDYSSWIYDFMLTGRPGFIFATDIALYNTERGFAYPLETTPFPIATDNKQMVENVVTFDELKYKRECREFLDGKGCVEHGHAAERVVDHMLTMVDFEYLED